MTRSAHSAAIAARDALLEAVEQPLLVFAAGGLLKRANAAARAALPALEPGRSLAAAAAPPALASAVAEALAGEEPAAFALTLEEPARRRFEVRLRAFAAAGGRGCVCVLREQTAQSERGEARPILSAGASHGLRTRLARILGLIETLALPQHDEERDATIAEARAEVAGMERLIDELLLLARSESDAPGAEADDERGRCEVAAAIEAVLRRHQGAAAAAGGELRGGSAPGLAAAISAPLLETVLDNLVENALRHAGPGARVELGARALSGAVELRVADDGRGISAEHLERVLEPYYRVEEARDRPGSGLGLAIVKHVAEAHGGRVGIASEPGRGVTVRVVLPAAAAPPR